MQNLQTQLIEILKQEDTLVIDEQLNKNQPYVNYSEIKDNNFTIRKKAQKLNDILYGKTF